MLLYRDGMVFLCQEVCEQLVRLHGVGERVQEDRIRADHP
jgi:hypothetical protein